MLLFQKLSFLPAGLNIVATNFLFLFVGSAIAVGSSSSFDGFVSAVRPVSVRTSELLLPFFVYFMSTMLFLLAILRCLRFT